MQVEAPRATEFEGEIELKFSISNVARNNLTRSLNSRILNLFIYFVNM